MQCVEKTKAVAKCMADKEWQKAVQLRGKSFERNVQTYRMLTSVMPPKLDKPSSDGFRMAVMHMLFSGIHDGVEGLIDGNIHSIAWHDVSGWVGQGGAFLGTKRTLPGNMMEQCVAKLREFRIQALLVIGGFEGYHTVLQFAEAREKYPELRIPMCVIPATISNNVPGTEFSLGADTALNEITEICDRIRQSAQGTKRRVFVVETMGGYCGYLATLAGLAGGCRCGVHLRGALWHQRNL
ncbi:hypothetical protein MRX96_048227 [Rhipicephalus microplus]